MELMRRLVDEANLSFVAAAKAIPLFWELFFEDAIPEDFIICNQSFVNAYLRLDLMDKEEAAAKTANADAPWAFAADGANKGTAVNIVAASTWSFAQRAPVAQPIACADLNSDQTARNSADTVIAALESSGFNPARCVQGLTDGAEAAKNEAKLVLSAMHTRHCDAVKASRGPPPQPRGKQQQQPMPPLPVQRSVRESCAIHAKALEERAFLEAAFPTLVEALRLMWELMKGDGAQLEFYRTIWTDVCKFRAELFGSALEHVSAARTAPMLSLIHI